MQVAPASGLIGVRPVDGNIRRLFSRHGGEESEGSEGRLREIWIPACAGMTIQSLLWVRMTLAPQH